MTFNDLSKVLDNSLYFEIDYYPEISGPCPDGIKPIEMAKNTMPAWARFADVKNIYEATGGFIVIVLKENTAAKVIRETIETYKTEV